MKETFKIVERSSMQGKTPIFRINYKGKMKELVFNNEYYERINFFTKVELEVRKGYFGFDVLENKKLN